MTQDLKIKKKAPRDPLLRRNWRGDRSLCLGGAGASLVVALAAFQILATESDLDRRLIVGAMTFAICAMALWVAQFQMLETYEYWASQSPEKVKNYPVEKGRIGPFAFAFSCLGTSISMLLISVAPFGCLVFFVVALFLVVFVVRHNQNMEDFINK